MFGKLLKYDGKSMFRIFLPLWLALLAVSFLNHFMIRSTLDNSAAGAIFQTVSTLLYVCLVVAVLVVTIALIILRFYNGLLKNEGYLMFTLPVRPWQLIASKCVLAVVVTVLSLVAGFLSIVLIGADASDLPQFFQALWNARDRITGDMVLCVVLVVILILTAVLAEITHIYAALALGHLANSHRIALAVLAYIVINIVLTALLMAFADLASYFQWDLTVFAAGDSLGRFNAALGILSAVFLVQSVLFFFITERILSKRLNLE